jgi:hypothetical protein
MPVRVPPPARGWPRSLHHHGRLLCGSPARAGMAPTIETTNFALVWFPRPRGDGPGYSGRLGDLATVPPPAWGWPRRGLREAYAAAGSPARAGMAPPVAPWRGRTARFPRPRGDGPGAPALLPDSIMVPPPARGGPWRLKSSHASAGVPPNTWGWPRRNDAVVHSISFLTNVTQRWENGGGMSSTSTVAHCPTRTGESSTDALRGHKRRGRHECISPFYICFSSIIYFNSFVLTNTSSILKSSSLITGGRHGSF